MDAHYLLHLDFHDTVFCLGTCQESFIRDFRTWIFWEARINHFSNFQVDFIKILSIFGRN